MNEMHMLLVQIYTELLPEIREVGRECGYAIAVHGSLRRDFDLIAVPWSDKVEPREVLIEKIMDKINVKQLNRVEAFDYEQKPYCRFAYAIPLGMGMYIDLSIIDTISN